MPSVQKIKQIVKQLNELSSYKNLESQANARYILYGVKEDEANFPAFTQGLSFKTENLAYIYLEIACTYYKAQQRIEAIPYFEKAGLLIEYNYANSNEADETRDFHLMVGALAYYCACQYSKAFILIKKGHYERTFNGMIGNFLKKDYMRLKKLMKKTLLDEHDEHIFTDVYEILLAKAFAKMMSYFLFGKAEYLDNAESIIADATKVALLGDDPAVWWEFRLLGIIFSQLHESSLWSNLKEHPMFKVDDHGWKEVFENFGDVLEQKGVTMPNWDRQAYEKLEQYIRSQIFKSTPITELFISQRKALEKVLSKEGAVVSMPTSSGKTRIAEIVILQCLMFDTTSRVLYIAPFRSLAYEMEETLGNTFNPLDYHVTHLYGGAQYTAIDRYEMESARVLIATPEKAKAILRANIEVVSSIKLIVMDEGHLLGKHERDITNEMFTEELRRIIRKNRGKFLVLSAVLPNAQDISKWLVGDENQVVKDCWRPSTQRIGLMRYHNNKIDLEWLGGYNCFNNSFVKTTNDKKTAIAEAAMKLLPLGSVLVYIPQNRWLMSQARPMMTLLQNEPDVDWGDDLDWKCFKLACSEIDGGPELVSMARKGLLCHGAQMPQDVRRYLERLLRKNKAKFIYSTTTLAQGVNLGVSTVIITGTYLGETFLSKRDFWNMAGRAGRSFIDTEGKTLLVCDHTKEEYKYKKQIREYISNDTPDVAVSGIYSNLKSLCDIQEKTGMAFDYLLELIAENNLAELNTDENNWDKFFEMIDDSLFSLDLLSREEDNDDALWVDEHFRNSLAIIQAENNEEREKFIRIIKARVKAVRSFAKSTDYPQAFSSSGIPLKVALYLEQHIDDVTNMTDEYLLSGKSENDLIHFFERFDTLLRGVNTNRIELRPEEELKQIRNLWFVGESLHSDRLIVAEKYYGYTVSWVLNALAGRYAIMEEEKYKNFFEEMALLASNGLPSTWATQIYLCGIHSRIVATELAVRIEKPHQIERLSEVFHYIKQFVNTILADTRISDLAKEWMKTLTNETQLNLKTVVKLPNFYFKKSADEVPDILFCRKYKDHVYLCSDDMTYKRIVNDNNNLKFSEVADMPGVYFEKADENLWKMVNVNPYVEIDGE